MACLASQPEPQDQGPHEEGGWIYQSCNGTELLIIGATPNDEDPDDPNAVMHIDLNNPPPRKGYLPIAAFHTHPFETYPGWPGEGNPNDKGKGYGIPDPSKDDQSWARAHGIPLIVISEVGLYCAGPQARVGPCRVLRVRMASQL